MHTTSNEPLYEKCIFDTECTLETASIVIVPIGYDGTASYGKGTRKGPEIVMKAIPQLDYVDPRFPEPERFKVFVDKPIEYDNNAEANSIGKVIREKAAARAREILERGQTPIILGGEHSVPQGQIEACAEHIGEIGLLQIDAHLDLRPAYEGYTYSHASVIRNIVEGCPAVTKIVQVGIRDYCPEEIEFANSTNGRVRVYGDDELFTRHDEGASWRSLWEEVVGQLPDHIYVTFDIDGLEPALCPGTGTPVPGGLTFNQATALLQVVAHSGKRVIGADLVEVGPSPDGSEWDANVGARVLYKLCRAVAPSCR